MFIALVSYFEADLPEMTNMTQSSLTSRKRGRCDGDDESRDFTPLSKRINNLHINNGTYSNHSASSLEETHSTSSNERSGDGCISNEGSCNNGIMTGVQQSIYNPDLNDVDNPFYYESNKLLYYLNIERMQRSGQSYG